MRRLDLVNALGPHRGPIVTLDGSCIVVHLGHDFISCSCLSEQALFEERKYLSLSGVDGSIDCGVGEIRRHWSASIRVIEHVSR